MTTLRRLLTLCFSISAFYVPAPAQKQLLPLPVEDALNAVSFTSITPIDLSPDGQWVAYTIRDLRRKEPTLDDRFRYFRRSGVSVAVEASDVWITNVKSGESKNLTGGKRSSWTPVWSPDGNNLAFYSDRTGKPNLWIWEKSSGMMRQVSDAIIRTYLGTEVPRWTRDGKHVLAKILPENMTIEEAGALTVLGPNSSAQQERRNGSTVIVYRSSPAANGSSEPLKAEPPPAFTNASLGDLAMINVSDGQVERIVRGFKPRWYQISPDGSYVALMHREGFENGNTKQPLYDLVVVPFATKQAQTLVRDIRQGNVGISVSWSPDGKLLGYTTEGLFAKGDLFVVPLSGGEPRQITKAPHPDFHHTYRGPLWDARGQFIYLVGEGRLWRTDVANGTTAEVAAMPGRRITDIIESEREGLVWSLDGRFLYVITRNDETLQHGIYKVDLIRRESAKLLEESKAYGSIAVSTDVSDKGQIVYTAEDAQTSPDIWVAGVDFPSPKRLTKINPHFDRYLMGSSRLIEWRGTDGQKLRGALLLPAGYQEGKRYPLLVYPYGGALWSGRVNLFGLASQGAGNFQLWATRGYAVLLPDTPTRVGTPMQDHVKAVMPGVDRVIELGIADPERLGVMGHSYGGYGVLALIVQTTRFKAAIDSAGFGNLFSAYGAMRSDGSSFGIAEAEDGLFKIGGSPWELRERFIENSPVFYLDKVQTPLLMVHGTADVAVPAFLGDEVFVGLRRLGKEVVYAKYEGEDHAQNAWSHPNVVDYWNRVIDWFDSHLRATPRDNRMSERQQ